MRQFWQIAIVVLTVLLLLSVIQCSKQQTTAAEVQHSTQDTITYFINRLRTQTASTITLLLEKKQLEKSMLDKNTELKKLTQEFSQVKSVVKYKTVTLVDSITIRYKDTLPLVFNRQGKEINQWYSFSWQATQNGTQIDSLQINTSTTVITGFKRKWFLGKQTLITDVTNTNPFVKVIEMQSAEVIMHQPWYKKWYIWLAVGAAGGYITTR